MQQRQGDIFFEKVSQKPTSKNLKKKQDSVIAYGEVTGHAHRISSPSLADREQVVDENGDIYVYSATAPIEIEHEEHGAISLEAGSWWCVTRQREYDPQEAHERYVAD